MSTRTRTPVDLDIDSAVAREAKKRAVREWNLLTPEQQGRADYARILARYRSALERQVRKGTRPDAWRDWLDLGGEAGTA